MYQKALHIAVLLLACFSFQVKSQLTELVSPGGKLKISVRIDDKIHWDVSRDGLLLLENCGIGLETSNGMIGKNPKLRDQKRTTVKEMIEPVVPLKFSKVDNHYNSLLLNFKGNYAIEFRAFDEGIAYRVVLNHKEKLTILDEIFSLQFPDDYLLHLQLVGGFKTSYEEDYKHLPSRDFDENNRMSVLPALIDTKKKYKILISETDLFYYPAMLIKGNGQGIHAVFPKYPLEQKDDGDRSMKILKEADYIACIDGKRGLPWRYLVITENDGDIVENTMHVKLAPQSKVKDPSWIMPGQTVWDWWNYAMPYGVDFKAGRNQDTYKYFIDFASENNIPYSLIDEGWAKSGHNPFEANPNVNMKELIEYAGSKNVKLILWLPWLAVENNMETLFKTYSEWGIAGVKIDFMERNDQWMVNYYERVAKQAADNQLIILFHGSFKPAGLEYAYPNVLSYEGVRGLEWKGGATADNGMFLPFMRNAVGPMDYTPGAMVSLQPEQHNNLDIQYFPIAVGTRALQMAHFVIFESGIQMLADNPARYKKEPECFDFIKSVPVTWDETRVLEAEAGEYLVLAKRKGEKWYMGAMTNSRAEERTFDIKFDFLPEGKEFRLISFEDGANADRVAIDYQKKERKIETGSSLQIKLARSGGWAAVIDAK